MKNKLDRVVQYLIPPSLVLLLIITIYELFYGTGKYALFIDIFDTYILTIFAIDLYFRWKELPKFTPFVKKHFLDIIATIPFNLLFIGIEGLTLIRALRGVRFLRFLRLAKLTKFTRFLRLLRFGTRAPRFLRIRKHVKKGKIRKVQPHEKKLKGVLSFKVILLITINSIMGTGIWFLTAAGAKHAGPASLISWAILSVISVYIAMCFAELVSMFPKAGGVYEFAKQAYGRFWSFVVGWTTSIAGSVTIAMLLLGSLQYLIPDSYSYTYIPIAIALILIFNYVAFRGMKTSTVMLVTFALITLVTVTAIIIPGFINLEPRNFSPFFVFPGMSILLTIFFIAETFFGWESAVFLSAETKNPTKVMPKALIYGTLVIAGLALLLSTSAMGVIPWEQYGESIAPLKDIGSALFGTAGVVIFTILVFTSIIGAVASWIVTAPRLLMSIAEDKLFFVQFARIHPKYKSPYTSIFFQVIVISILVIIGSGSYETLLHMLIPLILVLYSAVLLSVVILRYKKPNFPRPYRVIFGKFGPILTIFFMLFLLAMFIYETHGAWNILRVSASLIVFGIPAYFAIELFYEAKYVTLRRNLTAKIKKTYRDIPLPNRVFRRIISYVEPKSKDRLVDFNSREGSFTRLLIKRNIEFGKVEVINTAKEEVEIIKKIHGKHKKVNITHRKSRDIPEFRKVDIIVSFNDLGHIKNIPLFLKNIKRKISRNGRFCFYIHQNFFDIVPNAVFVEDRKKVKELFSKNGFEVNYSRRKRIFSEEIYVYGRKK